MNKVTGGSVGGDIDMRGHTITFLGLDNTDHAVARVSELKQKLDKNGNDQMNGNLNMMYHVKYELNFLGRRK